MSALGAPQLPSCELPTTPTNLRRSRPDVESDFDDEPVTKKARALSHPLHASGAKYGIMNELWRDISMIIAKGVDRPPNAPRDHYSAKENRYYDLFQRLLEDVLNLHALIQTEGGIQEVAKQIECGRTKMRNTAVYMIKEHIGSWRADLGNSAEFEKSRRGFHNIACGCLLCPQMYDYSSEAVRKDLRDGRPSHPAGAKDLPMLLWENETVDPDNLLTGFCRNILLYKAAVAVLFGPKAALHMSQSTSDANGPPGQSSNGKNTKPRAYVWRVSKTTPGLIGACAVLVHFALSSQETMHPGGTAGKWPYQAFYQHLVHFIQAVMPAEQRDDLLLTWDQRLFGFYADSESDSSDDDDNRDDTSNQDKPISVLKAMCKQIERGLATPGVAGDLGRGPLPSTQ